MTRKPKATVTVSRVKRYRDALCWVWAETCCENANVAAIRDRVAAALGVGPYRIPKEWPKVKK